MGETMFDVGMLGAILCLILAFIGFGIWHIF